MSRHWLKHLCYNFVNKCTWNVQTGRHFLFVIETVLNSVSISNISVCSGQKSKIEVLTVKMISFFWIVMPCGFVGRYRCFREIYCLYLQGWRQFVSPKHWFLPMNPHGVTTPEEQHRQMLLRHTTHTELFSRYLSFMSDMKKTWYFFNSSHSFTAGLLVPSSWMKRKE